MTKDNGIKTTKNKFLHIGRIANIRFFVVLSLVVIFVILSCVLAFYSLALGLSLLLLLVLLLVLFTIYHYKNGHRQNFVCGLFSIFIVIVVVSSFFGRVFSWSQSFANGNYNVSGIVDSRWTSDDKNYTIITLSKLKFDGKNYNGKMKFGITILDKDSDIVDTKIGDEIIFDGLVKIVPIVVENKIDTQAYLNNQMFEAYTDTSQKNIKVVSLGLTGISKIRSVIGDTIDKYFNATNAGILKAMLLGDKTDLDANGKSLFVLSGIAHVLTVSGLHSSILCVFFGWLFRKLKTNKKISFLLQMTILLLYASLANFGIPIIRVVIMTVVGGVCNIRHRWRDGLSTIAFASTLMLLFNPFWLFDSGYLLSFGSVLGINLFYRTFFSLISKIKISKIVLPNKIKEPLALTLSAQATSTGLTIMLMGKFNTYATISNILFLPIITILFILSLVFVPLCALMPFLSFVLTGLNFSLDIFLNILSFVASLPYAVIYLWAPIVFIVLAIIFTIFASRFFLKNKIRLVAGILAGVFYIITIFAGINWHKINYVVVPLTNNNTIVALDTKKEFFGTIGENASESTEILDYYHLSKLDDIFINDENFIVKNGLLAFYRTFGIKNIYVPYTMNEQNIKEIENYKIKVVKLTNKNYLDLGRFIVKAIFDDSNYFLGYGIFYSDTSDIKTNIFIGSKNFENYDYNNLFDLYSFDIIRFSSSITNFDGIQIVDMYYGSGDKVFVLAENGKKRYCIDIKNFSILDVY